MEARRLGRVRRFEYRFPTVKGESESVVYGTAEARVLDKARPFIVTSDYRPAQAEVRSGLLRARLCEPQAPLQMGLWG